MDDRMTRLGRGDFLSRSTTPYPIVTGYINLPIISLGISLLVVGNDQGLNVA